SGAAKRPRAAWGSAILQPRPFESPKKGWTQTIRAERLTPKTRGIEQGLSSSLCDGVNVHVLEFISL
ncbi:MAG TPA: hypothetical protein VEH77_01915, partial [Roseiarcus sp.]|nr:hypothetical protein [Roseiarcus sp.]